jgi:hypothetical protein
MGFSLTIQEGKDLGREYSFDQPEVSIGRTAENDVVLYDPGVSRRHVVIRCESGGAVFVQDLGSANGTQVNGNPVTEEQLQSGDLLSVGPVVFAFSVLAVAGSTRIVDSEKVESGRRKRALEKSAPAQLETTGRMSAAKRGNGARPLPAVKSPAAVPAARNRTGGAPAARPKPQAAPMLASERARLRRQNAGFFGRIRLFFIEAPRPVRIGAIAVMALIGLGLFAFLVNRILNPAHVEVLNPDHSHDMFKISDQPTKEIYGYGEEFGVTIQTKDELHLNFEPAESIPVVYYLKFEAHGVERKEEVEITLNGVHLSYVTPSMGDYTKAQRLKLPKKYLHAGVPNEIVLDNTENPPNSTTWAIAKIKLIIRPLPGCTPDECIREAKKQYDFADGWLQKKDIAAENRFLAWQALHKCLLFLEQVEPKPDLYALAGQTLRDVEKDLDSLCSRIMMTAKRAEELRDRKTALNTYKGGLMYFPQADDEHPCRGKLQEKIEDYGG